MTDTPTPLRRTVMRILPLVMLACMVAAVMLYYRDRPAETAGQEASLGAGGFDLIDQTGRSFTSLDVRGSYVLLFFGFTHCPDVCPMTLANISAALDMVPEEIRTQVRPVFVSVDPERDTPDVIAEYLTRFSAPFVGLTGSRAQVEEVIAAYYVYAKKTQDDDMAGGGYMMAHSTQVFILDEKGDYLSHFSGGTGAEAMAETLRELLGN